MQMPEPAKTRFSRYAVFMLLLLLACLWLVLRQPLFSAATPDHSKLV